MVMKHLLTGYAVIFSHCLAGRAAFSKPLQNKALRGRAYWLEPVRYFHLNPVRAMLVIDLADLDGYAYSGHCGLVGKNQDGVAGCEIYSL